MVHIDCPAAGCAGPAFPLGFYKRTDARFLYCCKVLEHAHAVLRPVAFVQVLQPLAGKLRARVIAPASYFFAGRNRTVYTAQPVGVHNIRRTGSFPGEMPCISRSSFRRNPIRVVRKGFFAAMGVS